MTAFRIKPMPNVTHRLHLDSGMDQWLGDSKAAIDHAAKLSIGSDGGRYVDINIQRVGNLIKVKKERDTAYGLHSSTARANGFHYIVNKSGVGRRKMTKAELDRNVGYWAPSQVDKWRRTAKYGRSYESKVKPERWTTLLKYAKKKKVIPCFECKSSSFDSKDFAERMAAAVQSIRWHVYFMALVNMRRCKEKGEAFTHAGLPFAVLAHSQPKPKDYDEWKRTQTWGPWR